MVEYKGKLGWDLPQSAEITFLRLGGKGAYGASVEQRTIGDRRETIRTRFSVIKLGRETLRDTGRVDQAKSLCFWINVTSRAER